MAVVAAVAVVVVTVVITNRTCADRSRSVIFLGNK